MHRIYWDLDFEHRAAAVPSGQLRKLMWRIVNKYFQQIEWLLRRQITDSLTRELNFHHHSALCEVYSTRYSVHLPLGDQSTILKLGPRAKTVYDLKQSYKVIDYAQE